MSPGDELIPDAGMVFDHSTVLAATPEEVWPWIVQLGKARGGWYMDSRLEPWLVWSTRRRSATRIEERWQGLAVGDSVPDYGGSHAELEVCVIDPPRALVYRSERGSAVFSWALLLDPLGPSRTRVHTRFRGRIRSSGSKRRLITLAGGFFDWATIALMFAGLRERVEYGP